MDSPHQDSYWLISQWFFSPQIIQLLQFFAQIMLYMFMTLNAQPNITYWCSENKQRNYFLIGETVLQQDGRKGWWEQICACMCWI